MLKNLKPTSKLVSFNFGRKYLLVELFKLIFTMLLLQSFINKVLKTL